MARTTHVKKAQQRFETVPVIDPETGKQKKTPVMVTNRDGEKVQKVSKRGPVFLSVTEPDKSKPLPLLKCDFIGCSQPNREIQIGTPYKHISPKSGPYGGRQLNRHESCPSWNVWDYSSSLSARLAQVEHDFQTSINDVDSADDVTSALSEAAEAVREIASEKSEGADNIEQGFGHETTQSEELRSTAESLESWADDIENAEVPDYPEPEGSVFVVLDKEGNEIDGEEHESEADAEAQIADLVDGGRAEDGEESTLTEDDFTIDERENEEPTEDQLTEWHEAVEDACSIVGECPV